MHLEDSKETENQNTTDLVVFVDK